MKVLSRSEMKKIVGGMAAVVCTMYLDSDNGCGGSYLQIDCKYDDLDTCQDIGDGLCGSTSYDLCCNDVSCKYA